MAELSSSSYDELPYHSRPMASTHPDNLATVARLYGLSPPDPRTCRVLELGCADGGNLIAMAQTLPEGHFVGLDASSRQIESGLAVLKQVQFDHVDLRACSILEIGPDWGIFDYIVCHGVFSWVTAEVQDKILAICADHLAPGGVAYVSYNTYPGWHQRGAVREMLHFHARQFQDAPTRVREARHLLDFLARSAADNNSIYRRMIQDEQSRLPPENDSYLFHEHLEDENRPLYFHEFQKRVESAGLQYLGEARPSAQAANLPPSTREQLARFTRDRRKREQYIDFVTNRTFRRSLLCRPQVQLLPAPSPDALGELHLTAKAQTQTPAADPSTRETEKFSSPEGLTLSTNEPALKTALRILRDNWPRAVPFATLEAEVASRLKQAGGVQDAHEDRQRLLISLLHCYLSDLVELRLLKPLGVLTVSQFPVASPLARCQAASDAPIANLRHRLTDVNPIDRLILPQLDGTHDLQALLDFLQKQVHAQTLSIDLEGQSVQNPEDIQAILRDALQDSLVRIAGYSLLVG